MQDNREMVVHFKNNFVTLSCDPDFSMKEAVTPSVEYADSLALTNISDKEVGITLLFSHSWIYNERRPTG